MPDFPFTLLLAALKFPSESPLGGSDTNITTNRTDMIPQTGVTCVKTVFSYRYCATLITLRAQRQLADTLNSCCTNAATSDPMM